MVEEAARRRLDLDRLAQPPHRQPVERLHRAVRLAMGRAEGREIVTARQAPARPCSSRPHRARPAPARPARPPAPAAPAGWRSGRDSAGRCRRSGRGNRRRPPPRARIATGSGRSLALVPSASRCGVIGLCDIDMRGHRQRMHARIGPPGGVERHLLMRDRPDRLLDRLLHRGAVRLPLPAHERPAVIFDGQAEAGHASFAPAGMAKPRSSSAGAHRAAPGPLDRGSARSSLRRRRW